MPLFARDALAIAFEVAKGSASGLLLLACFLAIDRRLRARSDAFPREEVAALLLLLTLMAVAGVVRAHWLSSTDQFGAEIAFLAPVVLMGLIGGKAGWRIIRRAGIAAGELGDRRFP